mmetsp:Transcript_19010/g.38231  ORF Transcript_19010/g.38231 Transcript_19010/m.38231 type:complete len:102 (-) Transcript_19010:247-552(-)
MELDRPKVEIEVRLSPASIRLRNVRRGWSLLAFGPTSKDTRRCCAPSAFRCCLPAGTDSPMVIVCYDNTGRCGCERRERPRKGMNYERDDEKFAFGRVVFL